MRATTPEFVEWVLCHELGHVMRGHARWLWRRKISRLEAEREADEFADLHANVFKRILA